VNLRIAVKYSVVGSSDTIVRNVKAGFVS
jgi:hypothetical protein